MVRKKSRLTKPLLFVLMTVILVFFLFPFVIALLNSFKPLSEILKNPLAAPEEFQLSNYVKAWETLNIPHAFMNTVIITGVSVLLLVLLTAMSSYWITRRRSRITVVLDKFIVGSALIPFATIMLPLVLVIRNLNLIGTYAAGILTYIGIGFPLAYLIMKSAVKAIPLEMDEAAMLDGCTPLQTLFHIIFPLLRPTIATVVISDVFWIWNEFQIALIFLNTRKLQTIQLAINSMFGQYSTKWDIALPGLLISIIPIVVLFLLMQKHVVSGIMKGAVKN